MGAGKVMCLPGLYRVRSQVAFVPYQHHGHITGVLYALDLLPARKEVGVSQWAASTDASRTLTGSNRINRGTGDLRGPASSSPVLVDVPEGLGGFDGKQTLETLSGVHVLIPYGTILLLALRVQNV